MQRDTHVVCYVAEVKAYLDFNLRHQESPRVPSVGSLKDIATTVADYFHQDWYAVCEFTYRHGVHQVTLTDFR